MITEEELQQFIQEVLNNTGDQWHPNEDIMNHWDRVDIDVDTLSEEDVL